MSEFMADLRARQDQGKEPPLSQVEELFEAGESRLKIVPIDDDAQRAISPKPAMQIAKAGEKIQPNSGFRKLRIHSGRNRESEWRGCC